MFDQQGPTDQQDGSQVPGPGVQQPSAEMPLPPPQTSGLAIASLVCGIVGFVSCGLGGLAGLILGIWAMVKITDNPLKRKGRGLAIGGICVSAVSLLIGLFLCGPAAMLMPALGGARGQARQAACRSNMRQVGLAVLMYANDAQDVLPDNLADVVDQGYGTPGSLVCPADPSPMWIGIGYQCSYDYLGDLSISEVLEVADAGRLIIAYE